MNSTERILVIRHGALGDFVMATGWMQAVRDAHPKAEITLMTQGFLASFARRMGLFDKVLVDDRKPWLSFDWLRICHQLAAEDWTCVYDFQCNHRTLSVYRHAVVLLTRHALRWVSFRDDEFRSWNTPAKPALLPVRSSCSVVDFAYRTKYDFSRFTGDPSWRRDLPGRYAVLVPGCSPEHSEKRWPASRYRVLSVYLADRGLHSIVLGTAAESEVIRTICDGNPSATAFIGVCTIEDIPVLARGAELVVGNDTGPTHLCRLAGAYTVMLLPSKSAHLAEDTAGQRAILADAVAEIPVATVEEACGI